MRILIFLSFFFIYAYNALGQCGCGAGASVGGLTPVAGTANVGVVREKNFRIFTYYSHTQGSDYFKNDVKTVGLIEKFYSDYLGLNASYGITRNLTAEADFGYFVNKSQVIYGSEILGRGPSHLSILGKYNIFYDFFNNIELTLGGGARIPMPDKAKSLPQHARPSTGAYGGIFQLFLYKGFEQGKFSLFLISRSEFNTQNEDTYQYGNSYINSFFVFKPLLDNLSCALELRNEFRTQDSHKQEESQKQEFIEDSGGNLLVISPQVSYSSGMWNLTASFAYPLYSYYNGSQLAKDFSVSLVFSIEFD